MALDGLIGALFGTAFGNPILVGLVGIVLFIIFLVAIKLSFEGAFALFLAFIHLLVVFGNLPSFTIYAVLIIDGIIISIAFLRLMGRR